MGDIQFNYFYKGKLPRVEGIDIGRTDIKTTYSVHNYECLPIYINDRVCGASPVLYLPTSALQISL